MSDLAATPGPLADERQRRTRLLWRTLPVLWLPAVAALVMWLVLHVVFGWPPVAGGGESLPPAEPSPERVVVLVQVLPPGSGTPPSPLPLLLAQLLVPLLLAGLLLVLLRAGRTTTAALVLVGVWTLFFTVGVLSSGVMSFWPASLVVPICAAALLLGSRASMALAALATLLVVGSVWLESHGVRLHQLFGPLVFPLGRPPPPPPPGLVAPGELVQRLGAPPPPLLEAGYWIGLFWTVAALTSLLADSLQRALGESRAQARALRRLSSTLEQRVAEQTAELAQRAERAEALYEVNRALTSTLDLPTVLNLIAEQAARLLRFEASLVLLDQGQRQFARVAGYREPAGVVPALAAHDVALARVCHERQPGVIALGPPDLPTPLDALALPLRYGTEVSGVLVLVDRARGAALGPDDLALAEGFADQAAVAIANARLLHQVREAATLEERARLAREIHDALAQGLTGIVVQLGALERALARAPGEAARHLELAQRMAREALAEARRSVWNLRSPLLERGDLGDALRSLAARPPQPGIAAHFTQRGTPWPLAAAAEGALLRVAQEALANVAKHAQATAVAMTLEYAPEGVRLVVQDNGVGFPAGVLDQQRDGDLPWGGFGLRGMRERLQALGGCLELTNAGGARVVATVPRAAAQQPARLLAGAGASRLNGEEA